MSANKFKAAPVLSESEGISSQTKGISNLLTENKYRKKCKDIRKRIREIEENNENLVLKLARTRRSVQRLRLERAFLQEKLEEREHPIVDDSDGSASTPASPDPDEKYSSKYHGNNGNDYSNYSMGLGDSTLGYQQNNGFYSGYQQPSNANYAQSPISQQPALDHTPVADNHSATPNITQTTSKKTISAHLANTPTSTMKTPRLAKDPHAPKRPANAFLKFCDLERERVRSENEGVEGFEMTKAMGVAWQNLDEEGRKPYYDLYEQDKQRYEREMESYVPPITGSLPGTVASPTINTPVSSGGFTAVNRKTASTAKDVEMQ
ncbi:Non-histone protein 10 [Neolecta irregularis DAH-3]|uniref:Non-histone protein 10 n=1 Tax=Neolecta irregularis (strain DAH-3) TaxID=1198029 RepID=A0A1U7LRZ3_NEOID|nr:Non-histone protein 10 [Neolecta irregularis DAH-3]|eukprot:OLL25414.1 Non-histone protein 10 [Neolecta irregularis DAH-3]